jgi:hypothetical protein
VTATGVGYQSFLGSSVEEASFGAATARTNFLEFTDESLTWEPTTKSAQGIRGGAFVPLESQDQVVSVSGGGDVTCYVPTKGFGRYLLMSMGAVATTTISGTGGTPSTDAYQHVFTMADLDGNSRTWQVATKLGGVYKTKTLTGTKVTTLKLAMAQSDFLTATLSLDAQNVSTTVAADTPTFLAGRGVFSYADANATLTVDGAAFDGVTAWDLSIPNELRTDGYFFGAGGTKTEQSRNGFPMPTGTLTAEWQSQTLVDKFMSQDSLALVITCTNKLINSVSSVDTYEMLKIEMPCVKLGGELPKVGGPGVISLSHPFRVLDNETDEPITVTYVSVDTAVT